MARQALIMADEAAQLRLVHYCPRFGPRLFPQFALLQFPFLEAAPAVHAAEVRRAQENQLIEPAEHAPVVFGELVVDEAAPPAGRVGFGFEGVDRWVEFFLGLRAEAGEPAFEQDQSGPAPGPCAGFDAVVDGLVEGRQRHRVAFATARQGIEGRCEQVQLMGSRHAPGREQGVDRFGEFQPLGAAQIEIVKRQRSHAQAPACQYPRQQGGQRGLAAALGAADTDLERCFRGLSQAPQPPGKRQEPSFRLFAVAGGQALFGDERGDCPVGDLLHCGLPACHWLERTN